MNGLLATFGLPRVLEFNPTELLRYWHQPQIPITILEPRGFSIFLMIRPCTRSSRQPVRSFFAPLRHSLSKHYHLEERSLNEPNQLHFVLQGLAAYRIAHVLITGHGGQDLLQLGEHPTRGQLQIPSTDPRQEAQSMAFFQELGLALTNALRAADRLERCPSVILDSCYTGKRISPEESSTETCLGAIASGLMPGVRVYAPSELVRAAHLHLTPGPHGKLQVRLNPYRLFYTPSA